MHFQCPKCAHRFMTPPMPVGRHGWACTNCLIDLLLVINADRSTLVMIDVNGEGKTGFTVVSHPALPAVPPPPPAKPSPTSRPPKPSPASRSPHPSPKPPPSSRSLNPQPRPAAPPELTNDMWNLAGEASGGFHRRLERTGPVSSGPRSSGPVSSGPVSSGLRSTGPVSGGGAAPKPRVVVPAEVPQFVGGYRVKGKITHNELGVVYAAEEVATGRPTDLLVLHRSVTDDVSFAARTGFVLLLASELHHPNLLAVGRPAEDGGLVYAPVERVPTLTLADGLRKGQRLPTDTAVGLALQAADALAFLHRQGIVHRRVNPNTLAVASGAVVKVTDWGSVHTSVPPPVEPNSAHPRVSSADYLAPELAHTPGLRDPRVDVYGLGCTLLALLTGRPPVGRRGGAANGPTSRDHGAAIPTDLSLVLARATATKPEGRFQSMAEFASALRQWQQTRPPAVTADAQAEFRRLGLAFARQDAGVWLAGIGLAVAVVAAAVLFNPYPLPAAGVLGFGLLAVAAGVVGRMAIGEGLVAEGVRTLIRPWRVAGGLTAVALAGAWVAAAWAVSGHLTLGGLLGGLLGLTAGLGYAVARERVDRDRSGLAARGHALLKELRLRGADEDTVRLFVKTAVGRRWGPIAHRLLGARAVEHMRRTADTPPQLSWGEGVGERVRRCLDQREAGRTRACVRWLQRRRLAARGQAGVIEQAEQVTADLLRMAGAVRRSADGDRPQHTYRTAYNWYPEAGHKPPPAAGRWGKVLDAVLHPAARVLVGMTLLLFGLLWLFQNGLTEGNPGLLGLIRTPETAARPLAVGWLPAWFGLAFASVNPILAGAWLAASAGWRSRWAAAGAWVAAVVAVGGPLGLIAKPIGPFGPSHVALGLAAILGSLLVMWSSRTTAAVESQPQAEEESSVSGISSSSVG